MPRNLPHPSGTKTVAVKVSHPRKREVATIHVPASHDGSRIKVEFPDGAIAWTDGFDPAEAARAATVTVACANCGAPHGLSATAVTSPFDCSACGARNEILVRTSGDSGTASDEGS